MKVELWRGMAYLLGSGVLAACASMPDPQTDDDFQAMSQSAKNPKVAQDAAPVQRGKDVEERTAHAWAPLSRSKEGYVQFGVASWYGEPFHGHRTASGERFNMYALTAAHRTLPLGTRVKVTHVLSGRSVIVRINDRGPYVHGRVIDLSMAAAKVLDLSRLGTARVAIESVGAIQSSQDVDLEISRANINMHNEILY
ncbi:rare lipoprotein A [Burkholderia ambifaria]|nr:septal ring lytic transglycosylase RlpA family protein [Burkholderia ambifaria]MDR6504049.1 rare lipoprotein A [Burkholderia ambifaria]